MSKTYYNRTLSANFAEIISEGGKLRWLYDYVKTHDDLDFLIGKNNDTEWISVYRGLSRFLKVSQSIKGNKVNIDAAKAYKDILPELYAVSEVSDINRSFLDELHNKVRSDHKFDKYYNKEGFYQNDISRAAGINSCGDSDFVIIDKEAVVGYENETVKAKLSEPLIKNYRNIQEKLSQNPKRFGKDLTKKSLGDELDFLALDKEGNIQLIEFKHGTNTSGIYLSPLQIGLYYDIFTQNLEQKELYTAITEMLVQKQKIGLISKTWTQPKFSGKIIPVLIISEYNDKSVAKEKFGEVLKLCRDNFGANFLIDLRCYKYSTEAGCEKLDFCV